MLQFPTKPHHTTVLISLCRPLNHLLSSSSKKPHSNLLVVGGCESEGEPKKVVKKAGGGGGVKDGEHDVHGVLGTNRTGTEEGKAELYREYEVGEEEEEGGVNGIDGGGELGGYGGLAKADLGGGTGGIGGVGPMKEARESMGHTIDGFVKSGTPLLLYLG